MSALTQQHAALVQEYNQLCGSKNHQNIVTFFEAHKQKILAVGSAWFLQNLISNNDVASIKYILQCIDSQKYINAQPYPLTIACASSSFEMIRLLVMNGATYKGCRGVFSGLIKNSTMSSNEIYLCADYLLTNINTKLADGINLAFYLTNDAVPCDRIKIAELLMNKRPSWKAILLTNTHIQYSLGRQHFEFADFLMTLMTDKSPLDPGLFSKLWLYDPTEAAVKWLLTHKVDINGYVGAQKITPLFQCCVAKNYKTMELLLRYGADINKRCIYNNAALSPLEYCQREYTDTYYEYFKNYNVNNLGDGTFVGVDLSNVPFAAYDAKWSESDDIHLNGISGKCAAVQKEISDLETELNAKYDILYKLHMEQMKIENKKHIVGKWNDVNVRSKWTQFLSKWRTWDVLCFIEYLKRIKYDEKTFDEYYSSHSICRDKIENYMKANCNEMKENEINNGIYFKGTDLLMFNTAFINGIGITADSDINAVYSSIQELIQTVDSNVTLSEMKEEVKEKEGGDGKMTVKNWLTEVVKLPQYAVFIENDITLQILPDVTRELLKEMGIKSIGHQIAILQKAKQLRQNNEGTNASTYL